MRLAYRMTQAVIMSTVLVGSTSLLADNDTQTINTNLINPIAMGIPTPYIQNLVVGDLGSLKITDLVNSTEAIIQNHLVAGNFEAVNVTVNSTRMNNGITIETVGDLTAAIRMNGSSNGSTSNSTMSVIVNSGGRIKGGEFAIEDLTAAGTGSSTFFLNNQGTIEAVLKSAIIDNIRSANWSILNQPTGIIKGGTQQAAIRIGQSTFADMAVFNNQGQIIADFNQTAIDASGATKAIFVFSNSGTISGKIGVDLSNSSLSFTNSGIISNTSALNPAFQIGKGTLTITGGQIKGRIVEAGPGPFGNAVINIAVGTGNTFTTEGAIDKVGNVNVESGTLALNHDITTNGNLTQAANTNLVVAGNRTVAGNLNLVLNSNVTLSLVSPTVFGSLAAGAASIVAGNVTVNVNNAQYIPDNTNFMIFQAVGGITEAAVPVYNLPNTAVLSFTRSFNGNNVTINARRKSIDTFVSNPRAHLGLATLLESLGKNSNNPNNAYDMDMQTVVGGFSSLATTQDVNNAFKELSPPTNGSTLRSASNAHQVGLNTVRKRLTLVKLEESFGDVGYTAGQAAYSDKGVWTQVYVQHGKEKEREGTVGYNNDIRGLTFGFDRLVNCALRLGGAFSYLNTKVHNDGRPVAEDKINSYQGSLYGTYDLNTSWLESVLSYTGDRHNTRRQIAFGFINRVALATHNGFQWSYNLTYNRPFITRHYVEIIPNISLAYHYAKERMYTEYNAGTASLRVQEQRLSSLEYGAGIKFQGSHRIRDGVFLPDVHMGLSYDAQRQRTAVNASFVGLAGNFTVVGPRDPHWTANIGTGLMFKFDNIRTSVNYEVTRKHYFLGHGGYVNVRMDL